MVIVNIFAGLILFLSIFGGLKEGLVKSFFSLVVLIISIPVTAKTYHIIASLLSFLGENWQSFIGFFITMAIISVVLHFIFFIPKKILHKLFGGGCIGRPVGAVISLFNAAVGLTVFALLIMAFPVWGWLAQAVGESSIMSWLVENMGFVRSLMVEVAQNVKL